MSMPQPDAERSTQTLRRVVVIEDDEAFRQTVQRSLQLAGFEVTPFDDAESAVAYLGTETASVVMTDLRLPGGDGLFVLEKVKALDAELPVVLMTGHGDIPTAIQAIRSGAYEFLEKPFSRERLLAVVTRASDRYTLVLENRQLKRQLAAASGINEILRGDSVAMRELRDLVLRLAPTPADVMVQGETGTGKELVARCLHDFSRRMGNFVAVNCAAIPETLFESELFGHEPGAFTGAAKQRIGKIEHAKDGTLFLDEIEAMPLGLQAKVLRVLQEREIERLGSNKPIAVNFRVVAATKVDLAELSRKGLFRADLFYRLNVVSLRIAPLRDRLVDVVALFDVFLHQASMRYQMSVPSLATDHHEALLSAHWPGNVRELKSCAERMVLGLPLFVDGTDAGASARSFEESMAIIERSLLQAALRRHGGSVRHAAAELRMNLATAYRKLKALGIDAGSYKSDNDGDADKA
jgi:DNA-binding NtrC family response regulator